MISSISRYAQGEMTWITTKKRGAKRTIYLNTVTSIGGPYTVSIFRYGDSFGVLSYKSYRDAERWWKLADANPHVFYPLDARPGQQLRVPT